MTLIYGDVCSGISAPTVAWKSLGWKAAWYSEIERFPSAVLTHHYPAVPNLGDMTKIHRRKEFNDGAIDLLVGGTPCQSFSVAGLRKGMADPRGNLALVFLGLADAARPSWVVWENVPGVLSADGGAAFGSFIGGLAELGYGLSWRILDAQHFGVPQRRRRVFVVGHSRDWRRAAAVLFERKSLSGNSPPGKATREGPSRGSTDSPRDGSQNGVAHRMKGFGDYESDDQASAIKSRDYKDGTDLVTHSLRGEGYDASEDGTGRGTPIVPIGFDPGQSSNPKATENVGEDQVPPIISARGPNAVCYGFSAKDHGADALIDKAPTLRAGGHDKTHANSGNWSAVANAAAVRRLTPIECERLQGFPDDYTLVPYRNKPACDGPRYKALGNSMAVPVMRWIGERIQMVEDLTS